MHHTPAAGCLLLCLLPHLALAGVLTPKEPGAQPLEVRKQALVVDVKDQVLRASLDEVFENLTDSALEGVYQLPLPDGAAVSEFATWVDGQRVVSRVQEKAQAAQTYEAAQRVGAQPALLEAPVPGIFRTRVDGIRAHGTRRIETSFAQVLPYDSGVVTLRLPLVVKGSTGAQTVGGFSFTAEISDQKHITSMESPLPVAIERLGPNRFRVSLTAKDVRPPPELVLTYRTESSRLGLSFTAYRPKGEGEGYFLLLASPQELTTAADIVHKDIVFVFDTSGSMSGPKIEQARIALRRCLGFLNPEDRFGVVAFSDSMNPFRNALVPASTQNVQQAIAFAGGLNAGGGTNISGSLLAALQMLDGSDRPRVLVFMTDGQPSAGLTSESEIVEVVSKKNAGGARLFSFGVGNDVNKPFLEKLAVSNRGSQDFVGDDQSIEGVVAGFYARISRPVLSDLAFDFGEVTTVMQYPDVLPDLYKGSQLVVVGRYRGDGAVKASLKGTLNGKRIAIPFEATFPAAAADSPFVARLWAQKRIDFLMSQVRLTGEREEIRTEVVALAEQYQILTPYTSLVAVRPEAVASLSPERVKPGDPVIRVRAPADARSVRITLPFGQSLAARWDADAALWSARFLIPAGTVDGSYPVKVEVELADGRRQLHALRVSIDTQAPALAVELGTVRPGEVLALRARARLGLTEVGGALLRRDDPYQALKSLIDVKRATAHLWDGREVPLTLDRSGLGFTALVETNGSMPPGRYPVVITAQDFAGNSARVQADVEVVAR